MGQIRRTRTTSARPIPKLASGLVGSLASIVKKILRRLTPSYPPNPPRHTNNRVNTEVIGFLQCPWQKIKRDGEPEAIFIIFKTNEKAYTNIFITTIRTKRLVTVFNSGASCSFIRLD